MSLWIKICGNTSLEDALLAADAGADAVGFVFAPSPRQVTAEQVAAITAHLPAQIEKIGVFVDAPLAQIINTVAQSGLTGVQLHSEVDREAVAQVRARLGPQFRILRVVQFASEAADRVQALSLDPAIDGVLVDSRTATAAGGTGIAFDWSSAAATVFQGTNKPLIVAGGLNPANVQEAIATLRPWGVDVVSGVEAAPGRKDPTKVRAFVANARAATRASRLA
ncbi:MAG TPA: phosphoribosylanthranilate isomerase [Terracidiphilus sp.]|nr:phosphoribosylanthranilate isomerase [Terracidiphilus sp.]